MKWIVLFSTLLIGVDASAAEWVEVGADQQATYYVDVASITVEADTVRIVKKGVYTQPLTENFGGTPRVFNESVGKVELDCGRRINRVVEIEMLGVDGTVVWASGPMPKRLWEDVQVNTHAEARLDFVCARLKNS
ncbi:MAG: surface-adhesin E family protein [Betaproteobacteria bacterium]